MKFMLIVYLLSPIYSFADSSRDLLQVYKSMDYHIEPISVTPVPNVTIDFNGFNNWPWGMTTLTIKNDDNQTVNYVAYQFTLWDCNGAAFSSSCYILSTSKQSKLLVSVPPNHIQKNLMTIKFKTPEDFRYLNGKDYRNHDYSTIEILEYGNLKANLRKYTLLEKLKIKTGLGHMNREFDIPPRTTLSR